MLGRKAKKNILILIEWKYTENYNGECLHIEPRWKIYNPLLEEHNCPIDSDLARIDAKEPFKALYYEPYYQLMRQTLLGWKMADANEYGADDFIHLHIIPDENREMLGVVTAKELRDIKHPYDWEPVMEYAWQSVLKDDSKYKRISPQAFLEPLKNEKDTKSLLEYLGKRYWKNFCMSIIGNKNNANRDSWTNIPIDNSKEIEISLEFTESQYFEMQKGLIPEAQEDKWFIYFENDWLFFHRSWTGHGIYKAEICKSAGKYFIKSFFVERNDQKYSNSDDEKDRDIISFLITWGLLHIDVRDLYVNKYSKGENGVLETWGNFGSLYISQHDMEKIDSNEDE
jgi:hypothetical protein